MIGPFAESHWLNVYPDGFKSLMQWIDARYGHPKILVFENGVSVPNENNLPIAEAVHDKFRVDFYNGYLGALS